MDANETEDACVQNDGKTVVLYGAKTWAVKELRTSEKLVVETRCVRAIRKGNKTRENEKRRHKEGIEDRGTEREKTRK